MSRSSPDRVGVGTVGTEPCTVGRRRHAVEGGFGWPVPTHRPTCGANALCDGLRNVSRPFALPAQVHDDGRSLHEDEEADVVERRQAGLIKQPLRERATPACHSVDGAKPVNGRNLEFDQRPHGKKQDRTMMLNDPVYTCVTCDLLLLSSFGSVELVRGAVFLI